MQLRRVVKGVLKFTIILHANWTETSSRLLVIIYSFRNKA